MINSACEIRDREYIRRYEALKVARGGCRCAEPSGNLHCVAIRPGEKPRLVMPLGRPLDEVARRFSEPDTTIVCTRCLRRLLWNGKGPPLWMHSLLEPEERERLLAEEEEEERHG